MTYSDGHPVRLIGGRLALDFVNTADWSDDAGVVHEKIASAADLGLWLEALGLESLSIGKDIFDLLAFRYELRQVLLGDGSLILLNEARSVEITSDRIFPSALSARSLQSLLAISAISIMADKRELDRLKMCPGEKCGWLFIDETKNARRKWCSMESCGNRAKAARHYARTKPSLLES